MPKKQLCPDCGEPLHSERANYRYRESGVPGIVLQGVRLRHCPSCGHDEVELPHLDGINRAIALGLINSPRRLTGPQFRFLRKYLELSGDELGKHLRTDKTKISKWERGEDPIGPRTDCLIRLLAAALSPDLADACPAVARHLPAISDEAGEDLELHVDIHALTFAHLAIRAA